MVRYTFANVGNTFSARAVSDYLKAEHQSLDNETVYSYLEKLEKRISYIAVPDMICRERKY